MPAPTSSPSLGAPGVKSTLHLAIQGPSWFDVSAIISHWFPSGTLLPSSCVDLFSIPMQIAHSALAPRGPTRWSTASPINKDPESLVHGSQISLPFHPTLASLLVVYLIKQILVSRPSFPCGTETLEGRPRMIYPQIPSTGLLEEGSQLLLTIQVSVHTALRCARLHPDTNQA